MKKVLFIIAVFTLLLPGIAGAVCNPLDPLNCIVETQFDNDGVVNPDEYYMRDRQDEYDPAEPYFGWWYFTVKDLASNRYFALSIGKATGPDNPTNEMSIVMFSMVDKAQGTKFHTYERYGLDQLEAVNNGEAGMLIGITDLNGLVYAIDFYGPNQYHLTGSMTTPVGDRFFTDGTLNGSAVPEDIQISWDLVITRVYGWYGQQDSESLLSQSGIISWNTYAHTSRVVGTITVGANTYQIVDSPQFRAYCDMNWGENFPSGSPALDYRWGWYYVSFPATANTPEYAIIAGVGRHDTNDITGIAEGSYADMNLYDGHTGVRKTEIWKPDANSSGYVLLGTASDGEMINFNVEADDWGFYTDSLGSAEIPYSQVVTIETTKKKVVLEFTSGATDYNRLLFPHQDYWFSDFEGLGVNCNMKIWKKTYPWYYFGFPKYTLFFNQTSNDAGIEYGYFLEVDEGQFN